MQGTDGLPRRRFIQVAASGTAATVSCGGQKSRYRFLTNAEADTLAAVCDVIIPPDQDPGASQAGVVRFIDRQLDGFHKKLRKQYHNEKYPEVVLRFEDGHEIKIPKATMKSFDAWAGERIKILAIWDHTSGEREKVDTLLAEQFTDEGK